MYPNWFMQLVTVHRRIGLTAEDAEEAGITSVVMFWNATPF